MALLVRISALILATAALAACTATTPHESQSSEGLPVTTTNWAVLTTRTFGVKLAKVNGVTVKQNRGATGKHFNCLNRDECELAPEEHAVSVSFGWWGDTSRYTPVSPSSEGPTAADILCLEPTIIGAACFFGAILWMVGEIISEKVRGEPDEPEFDMKCITNFVVHAAAGQRYEVTITQPVYNERPQLINVVEFETDKVVASGPCE